MRIKVTNIMHPTNSPAWIIVDDRGVRYETSHGTQLALSNLFNDEAAPVTFELEDIHYFAYDKKMEKERMLVACNNYITRFLSGPDEGKPTHSFVIWESAL